MRWAAPESLRYLAGAVLLAFATSAALHLPERFWAVMSALIVVRPDTSSTLGAGWNRIRGLGRSREPRPRSSSAANGSGAPSQERPALAEQ